MCVKMLFKMLNTWMRLIIVQVTSANDKFSLFAIDLFNVFSSSKNQTSNTNHSAKWDSFVCLYLCDLSAWVFFLKFNQKCLQIWTMPTICASLDVLRPTESECNAAEFGVTARIQLYCQKNRRKKEWEAKNARAK